MARANTTRAYEDSDRTPLSAQTAEVLLDAEVEALVRKAVTLALDGDALALRLCLDRIIAPRRTRPVHLELPPIADPADIAGARASFQWQSARISAFRLLMRGFGETDFDDCVIRYISGAGGRERWKLLQLLRCEGDDLHVLPEQHHGIHGNGYRPAADAEKPAEIDDDHDLTVSVANDATNPAENILALDRTQNLSTEKIADANRLREPHGSRLRQAHARRRRHASRCRALRVRRARGGERSADHQEAERRHGGQIPANHEKPNDSQYPPGYLLVTSMAVTHFGFL
jgi:hypothetical protein